MFSSTIELLKARIIKLSKLTSIYRILDNFIYTFLYLCSVEIVEDDGTLWYSLSYKATARHELIECNTSATQVQQDWSTRGTSAIQTAQWRHDWKALILIKTQAKHIFGALY